MLMRLERARPETGVFWEPVGVGEGRNILAMAWPLSSKMKSFCAERDAWISVSTSSDTKFRFRPTAYQVVFM